MQILAVKKNRFEMNELYDFFADDDLFIAENDRKAIQLLKSNRIELVLVNITSHSDFGLVHYINNNFEGIRIILSIQKDMQDAFSVITKGKYQTLQNPMKLKELKRMLK
jgi:response regulator RpfG family c-di-GMP phosphodiesterase